MKQFSSESLDTVGAAEKNLARLLEWITRADSRTTILLGVELAMLGGLLGFAPSPTKWSLPMGIFIILSLALLGSSLACLFLSSFPRLRGGEQSLLYFREIARASREDYAGRFIVQTKGEYLTDVLGQCHRNAEVLSVKFGYLSAAFRLLVGGAVTWVVAIGLVAG